MKRGGLALALAAALLPVGAFALDLGWELRATAEWAQDEAGLVPGATREGYGQGGLSARAMAGERWGTLAGEVHLLLGAASVTAGGPPFSPAGPDPFRVWDLEKSWGAGERTAFFASLDRFSLAWEGEAVRLTGGRFAVTWGDGWFFNPLDLFGAFAPTAIDRSFKSGIDGAMAVFPLGPFGEIAGVLVPSTAEHPQSLAFRVLFPIKKVSVSLLGGNLDGDGVAGGGVTLDLAGSKVYAQGLKTRGRFYEDVYNQWVVGWERQTGPRTHVLVELYRNGWGTDDPDGYGIRTLVPRFLEGRVPTLGRWEAAAEASAQLSPLVVGGAGVLVNLLDGSALAHLAGSCSLSDFAELKGGLFAGLGKRPREGEMRSEYGSAPSRAYLEVAASF